MSTENLPTEGLGLGAGEEPPGSQGKESPTAQPPGLGEDHAPLSVEDETLGSEEEGEGAQDGVGRLLRATVEELEVALKDTRHLLAARDEELEQLKQELDRYRQQAAREIANKTRLAQALDHSQTHVAQLEEVLQNWQLQVQDFQVQGERLQSALRAEQVKNQELESQLVFEEERDKELSGLRSELDSYKTRLPRQQSNSSPADSAAAIDRSQQLFLKQAVFHLLTDFHAEEQLRAIVSILDFNAQERKAVYGKIQQKGGLYK